MVRHSGSRTLKKVILLAAVAALFATPALAGDRQQRQTLPDGSIHVSIVNQQWGLVSPSSTTTTAYHCSGTPMQCTPILVQSDSGPGAMMGIPQALIHATGNVLGARGLRPDETNISAGAFAEGGRGGNAHSDSNSYSDSYSRSDNENVSLNYNENDNENININDNINLNENDVDTTNLNFQVPTP